MSEGWKSIDRAELEAVDWAGLKHNYGTAEDVPDLLRRCAGSDPDDAEHAAVDLLNHLYHQGGWVCPAAAAALPFVLRLAAAPQVTPRRTLLELVGRLAAEAALPADDRRLYYFGGWRGFTEDESIRTAVDRLSVATGGRSTGRRSRGRRRGWVTAGDADDRTDA